MKTSAAVIILLLLSLTGSAQQKSMPLWDYSDAALVGSFIADEASTRHAANTCSYCYEAGVIKSAPGRAVAKIAIFSAFKILEWKSPQVRRGSRWVKLGLAITFTVVSVHNAKK